MKRQPKHDIEIIREAIELFTIRYFDTIEMSGAVSCQKKVDINYFSIDFREIAWDETLDTFHQALTKFLSDWGQNSFSQFNNYTSVASLTVEYLLPEKDGANQNQSKQIKLFYLPSYFFRGKQQTNEATYSGLRLKFLMIWHNVILRNFIIAAIPTVFFIILSLSKIHNDDTFAEKLSKSYDYINVASGIIASLVLGFLIDKVIAIRQHKLKYTNEIRELSNKLTYFRNICFNFIADHDFWTRDKEFYTSYEYGNSIKHDISFREYYYPNYEDKIKYARYKAFYKEGMWNDVVSLILQLHMMADESFLDSGLFYTAFPPNHIYSHEEMQDFILFSHSNLIWYCSSESKILPKTFRKSYRVQQIIADINRIYPEEKIENLSGDKLEEVSLDFQYRIIPHLYNLTRIVDSGLSVSVKYFVSTVSTPKNQTV